MTTLQEQIRQAAKIAEKECTDDNFNAMTWLDLILEENPQSFDTLFNTTWEELSEEEKVERTIAIRRVL